MDIEKYFLAILLAGCVAFIYFAFKHVSEHEKRDATKLKSLYKPKNVRNESIFKSNFSIILF